MTILARLKSGAFAFVLAVLLALGLVLISESSYRLSSRSLDRLGEINAARLRLQTLITLLVDAETGQRGYLLTSDADYLRPYRDALEGIDEIRGALQTHFAPRDDAAAVMALLGQRVDQRLAELATILQLHDAGQPAAALELLRANFGKEQMDSLRGLAEQLLAEESRQRDRARNEVYEGLRLSRVGVGAMALVALLALALYLRQKRALESQRAQSHRAVQAERDRLEAEVRRRTAQLTELARHLQTAREDERGRLARELHDELGALLTAAKLDVARIRTRVSASPEARERIAHLSEILNSGIALKRRIIEDLRPSSLANLGLVAAIENLAHDFEARSRLDVACSLQAVELPPEAQLTAYRVVQESLTNIAKHARAHHVEIGLEMRGEHAAIEVRDDGIGFDGAAAAPSAHGLLGMRYRVEGEGGTLAIDSAPGKGTCVAATLPTARRTAVERRGSQRPDPRDTLQQGL